MKPQKIPIGKDSEGNIVWMCIPEESPITIEYKKKRLEEIK